MADFRRQTPAGELQISVAEITEAADPLGPRLETPLVFSIARFPFAKRKSSFPNGEPEVRIHLPPAERWYGAGGEEMAPSSLQPTDGVP